MANAALHNSGDLSITLDCGSNAVRDNYQGFVSSDDSNCYSKIIKDATVYLESAPCSSSSSDYLVPVDKQETPCSSSDYLVPVDKQETGVTASSSASGNTSNNDDTYLVPLPDSGDLNTQRQCSYQDRRTCNDIVQYSDSVYDTSDDSKSASIENRQSTNQSHIEDASDLYDSMGYNYVSASIQSSQSNNQNHIEGDLDLYDSMDYNYASASIQSSRSNYQNPIENGIELSNSLPATIQGNHNKVKNRSDFVRNPHDDNQANFARQPH